MFGDIVNRSNWCVPTSQRREWVPSKGDGSYRYTHAASGEFIAGVVITEGTYEARGDTVLLHQKTENWYPFHNDPSHKPMFKDKHLRNPRSIWNSKAAELRVWDKNPSLSTTFHRDPNTK